MQTGYDYNHPTYLKVAMPEEVDPNFFNSHIHNAIQADMTCMNNISWSGAGKSNIWDNIELEGNAQIHAQQVSVSIALNHFVAKDSVPNLDSIFQLDEPSTIIQALMNQSFRPAIEFKNARNISGEFMGTVSSRYYRQWKSNGTIPEYYSSHNLFYNGSYIFQDGGFDGWVGLGYFSDFSNYNFSGISKFEWKNNTQDFGEMVFASYKVSFVAESVSVIGQFNSTYLSFDGNTKGKVDFHGMGGLLNSTVSIRIYNQPYQFLFFSKDMLFAIIPTMCLIGFVVHRAIKNKEKYFTIQSTANK
ncbi:hypothetical protein HDV01_003257 [Terramyces sp. JEL0728]|nr:hypothetical protein HDV01_003257 [Terramyces sp. JEL0728]